MLYNLNKYFIQIKMNFNNLEVNDTYLHSRAKKAVLYSKEAEFMGNNFMHVMKEK